MKNIFALSYVLVAVVEIYGAEWCPYCKKAEQLLKDNKIEYIKHEVSNDRYERAQFLQKKFNYKVNLNNPKILKSFEKFEKIVGLIK